MPGAHGCDRSGAWNGPSAVLVMPRGHRGDSGARENVTASHSAGAAWVAARRGGRTGGGPEAVRGPAAGHGTARPEPQDTVRGGWPRGGRTGGGPEAVRGGPAAVGAARTRGGGRARGAGAAHGRSAHPHCAMSRHFWTSSVTSIDPSVPYVTVTVRLGISPHPASFSTASHEPRVYLYWSA